MFLNLIFKGKDALPSYIFNHGLFRLIYELESRPYPDSVDGGRRQIKFRLLMFTKWVKRKTIQVDQGDQVGDSDSDEQVVVFNSFQSDVYHMGPAI